MVWFPPPPQLLRHPKGSPPPRCPCSWRGPAALPAVLHYDGPSGLPLVFSRRCRRLPCSEVFLRGTGRGSPVPTHPFLTCCRHYPAGTSCGFIQFSAAGAAFAGGRGARLPVCSVHGACSAFDTCGPSGRFPTPGRICQEAPRSGFPFARLLSFMFLAPFMLGLSPTGLRRLPSGHGGHGHPSLPCRVRT
jgi:hypothetical protein